MESSANEERLRDAPLPGSVRGQRAMCGKQFQPYSYQKVPGNFPVNTSRLRVERQQHQNEHLLRRKSASQGGYAADSSFDDDLGTTNRLCRGTTPDPEVGSGEGEMLPDHLRLASFNGGAQQNKRAPCKPCHAFCSLVAGRQYAGHGSAVLDS